MSNEYNGDHEYNWDNEYNGDDVYSILTDDACVGDQVRFNRHVHTGFFGEKGYKMVTAEIIRESYGKEKQQHTFTLRLEDGSKTLIKGRKLYENGLYRKQWENEEKRKEVLDEKHIRGEAAREARNARRDERYDDGYDAAYWRWFHSYPNYYIDDKEEDIDYEINRI